MNSAGNANASGNANLQIGNNYHETHNHFASNTDQCLKDLRVTDPRDDMARIEGTKGGLLEGSYNWILGNSEFRQWCNDEDYPLLWIKGDPGKGKTMLLCGIIDELKKESKNHLSFFFCQGTDSRLNNATAVLRGLTYLLIVNQPSLKPYVQQKYDHAGQSLFEDANAWWAMSEILSNILQDQSLENTILLIDGLDECATDLSQLLGFIISNSSNASRVKWVVTSRNWPNIEEHMKTAEQKVKLSLELNESSISASVKSYIQHRVDELAQKKRLDDETRGKIKQYLGANANDTFLWVSLVCQALEKTNSFSILAELKRFPPGLYSIYQRMMSNIQELPGHQDLCMRLLGLAYAAYRPITLRELEIFIDLPEGTPSNSNPFEEALAFCGSFLTLRNGTIYFVHQSAKDFLLKEALGQMFPSGIQEQHLDIFSRSLVRMSKSLRRDIYGLGHPGASIHDFAVPNPDPLAQVRYACVYWVDHLGDGISRESPSIHPVYRKKVYEFLSKKFIYWLEALGLLHAIAEGIVAMSKLEELMVRTVQAPAPSTPPTASWFDKLRKKPQVADVDEPSMSFLSLVCDAHQFFQSFRWAIDRTPLQVYSSALLFSPAESTIRALFEKDGTDSVTLKSSRPRCWSDHQATLEGHTDRVIAISFSPDGRHLASASGDGTIKMWDIKSGRCRATMNANDTAILHLQFSHDGQFLISVSDEKIETWSVAIGSYVLVRTLLTSEVLNPDPKEAGYRCTPGDISFSHDRNYLLCRAVSNVYARNITTGVCNAAPRNSATQVLATTFYPDSNNVLLMDKKGSIDIWDIESNSRQPYRKLNIQTKYNIQEAKFSPNGHLVAIMRAYNGTFHNIQEIVVCDVDTGISQYVIPREYIHELVFSPDSECIAYRTSSGPIIYDAKTSRVITTLNSSRQWNHTDINLAISPRHCQLLATREDHSHNKIIRLWKLGQEKKPEYFFDPKSTTSQVFASPNNQKLAVGYGDGTWKIWDVATGRHHVTIHDRPVFSSDGLHLAYVANSMLTVWDIEGSNQVAIIAERHFADSFGFATDNNKHIWTKSRRDFRVWDVESCHCLIKLPLGKNGSISYQLSPDGQRVVAASEDGTIRIWDVTNGHCQTINHGTPKLCRYNIFSIAFTSDCRRIGFRSQDGDLVLWYHEGNKSLFLERPTGYRSNWPRYMNFVFSPSGQRIAAWSEHTVHIWNTELGKHIATLHHEGPWVVDVYAFSVDDQYLVSKTRENIKIWNISMGNCHEILKIGVSIIRIGNSVKRMSPNKSSTRLLTDIGTFDITAYVTQQSSTIPPQSTPLHSLQTDQGLSISTDYTWIMRQGKRLLWLPTEYREKPYFMAGSTIIFKNYRHSDREINRPKDFPNFTILHFP